MTITVWLFFIFGVSHQAIDNFPTLSACEQFRANVVQMTEQFKSGSVSECMPRRRSD